MTNESKRSALRELFSENMVHARHLENYLLSFTQVFLLITGALWGYALVRLQPLRPMVADCSSHLTRKAAAADASEGLGFIGAVFCFHLFYSFVGMLFVVRSGVNFRKHWEMAHRTLADAGLANYIVRISPESPQGELERAGLFKPFGLLLTVKAFFLLLYAGAAGVDSYFGMMVVAHKRILQPVVVAILISLAFVLLLLALALAILRAISVGKAPQFPMAEEDTGGGDGTSGLGRPQGLC